MPWLLRGDEVLASLEVAEGFGARLRGLLGRADLEGALLLPHTRAVHTVGMRFPIDVAWCDEELVVVRLGTVGPNRLTAVVRGARSVIEAEAGAFARWQLQPGDRLEVH